jgi:hypothetical protein
MKLLKATYDIRLEMVCGKLLQLSDGQKVELGATWLHGITGHPLYELAVKYCLMEPHLAKGSSPPLPTPFEPILQIAAQICVV